METTITRYYHTFPNQISVCFEETDWGGITSILPDKNAQPLTNPSKAIIGLIETYTDHTQKIRSRYTGDLGPPDAIADDCRRYSGSLYV